MNDTDSLLVMRLHRLRNQPKTFRGRCILCYATLSARPCARILLFLAFTVFSLLHTLSFCAMLYACYDVSDSLILTLFEQDKHECTYTVSTIILPLLLLSIYPWVLIPFIILVFIKDILVSSCQLLQLSLSAKSYLDVMLQVKREGLMVWHRDSIGVLIQRFFFSIIIMSSILTFNGCYQDDAKQCIIKTGAPLIIVLLFVFIKVACLRQQQIYLWSGFILCLIAQFIVVSAVGSEILDSGGSQMQQILMFLPCVTFGLATDVQIIVSSRKYKPIAFTNLPFKHARQVMQSLGVISLIMSICAITLCILIYSGIASEPKLRSWLFLCMFVKATTWSPFIGIEYYDTLFEHIYHDVQF